MSSIINSLWIKGELQHVNELCIRSFKAHGHHLIIWTYDHNLHADCEIRDAREILPESEVFYYRNMMDGLPQFKFGGIAERLKAELLLKVGGWHVDLDVTCLKNFNDLPKDYVLAPHPLGIVGNIIKAPAGCAFAEYYAKWTRTIDEHNQEWSKSFRGLNAAAVFLDLEKYKVPFHIFGMDGDEYVKPLLLNSGLMPTPQRYAVHWCGAMQWYKDYQPGSFYHQLLQQYKLC